VAVVAVRPEFAVTAAAVQLLAPVWPSPGQPAAAHVSAGVPAAAAAAALWAARQTGRPRFSFKKPNWRNECIGAILQDWITRTSSMDFTLSSHKVNALLIN
jgi:soluble lytic murein transglycosylase-like protein